MLHIIKIITKGTLMSVTVISKRVFNINKNKKLISLLKKLRKHAEKQKGLISRATFTNINDAVDNIVISEWKSEKHWKKWLKEKEVRKILGKIDSLIGEKTVFDVYSQQPY